MLAVLRIPPGDHRDPPSFPGNSFGFLQCSDRVRCLLEGVESRHHIKACIRKGKLFHVSNAEVPIRYPLTRNLNECDGGIDPRHLSSELCSKLCRQTRSTADIEQAY